MADALTHAAAAAWLAPLWRRAEVRYALYFGALLPDLFGKVYSWVLEAGFAWSVPTHAVAGVVLYAYAVAHVWPERDRPGAFLGLAFGGLTHIGIDALKDPLGRWGVFPLAPIWNSEVALGWVETEYTVLAAPVFLALVVGIEWRMRRATVG